MTNKYIEFKKKRELGEILTDTFAFIRSNFKQLFSTILKTSAPILVLLVIALIFMTYSYSDFIGTIGFDLQNSSPGSFNSGLMIISILVLVVIGILFYGILFGTILHYIKSYIHNQGIIDTEEVKKGVKKDYGRIIGLSLISGLITGFGFLLCFLPGIYLYVPMSLVFAILIFKNLKTFETISYSFELIKNEWWITFVTLLVISIIGFFISGIFAIPAFVYGMLKGFAMATEGSFSDPSSMVDWISITLSVIGDLVRYFIMYLLTSVSSAFIYFNLNERKYHTGTLEQIDSLGKPE